MRAAYVFAFLLSFATGSACSAGGIRPPCDETKLRAVDKDYGARVLAVCLAKYPTKEACPEFPALQRDHRAELRKVCPQ
jgi:hypothetical protein